VYIQFNKAITKKQLEIIKALHKVITAVGTDSWFCLTGQIFMVIRG